MKALIVKKGRKVIGVVIPNTQLKYSCTIAPSKGSRVETIELGMGDTLTRKEFLSHLQRLGAAVETVEPRSKSGKQSRRP